MGTCFVLSFHSFYRVDLYFVGVGNPNDLMSFISTWEQSDPALVAALNSGQNLGSADFEQQKAHFAAMQFSVSFGLSMFHTVFNVINVTIMIWFTGLYERIVTRLVRVKDKNEEEFQLKFISRGMLSASELNLPQAHQRLPCMPSGYNVCSVW